jgi:hypothetical protein
MNIENSNNIMEWQDGILAMDKNIWSMLVCATSLNYVHKISGTEEVNMYLVSEKFYVEAVRLIQIGKFLRQTFDN